MCCVTETASSYGFAPEIRWVVFVPIVVTSEDSPGGGGTV
jgi:hypothetical protein